RPWSRQYWGLADATPEARATPATARGMRKRDFMRSSLSVGAQARSVFARQTRPLPWSSPKSCAKYTIGISTAPTRKTGHAAAPRARTDTSVPSTQDELHEIRSPATADPGLRQARVRRARLSRGQ